MSTSSRKAVFALALLAAGACGHPQPAPLQGTANGPALTGTVAYRERVALPSDAVVEIVLVDATMSSDSTVVARSQLRSEGKQVPLPFTLRYDPHAIDKTHLYTIHASIRSGDQRLWSTDVPRAVLTQGNPTKVDIALTRVDPTARQASGDLLGSSWVLEQLNGERVITGARVTLDFSEKGKVTGNGSCNRYFATVDISGSSIRIGAVGATRMACATPISLQEIGYFEALESASRFEVENGTLSIYGSARLPLRFTSAAP